MKIKKINKFIKNIKKYIDITYESNIIELSNRIPVKGNRTQ